MNVSVVCIIIYHVQTENVHQQLHDVVAKNKQQPPGTSARRREKVATDLINTRYKEAAGNVAERIEEMIRVRIAHTENLITQMTTPEAVEALMVKACAALMKRQIK